MASHVAWEIVNDCWQRLLFWVGAFFLSLLPAFYLMTDATSKANKLSLLALYTDHYTAFMPTFVAFLSVACLNGYDIQRRMPTKSTSHTMIWLVVIPTLTFTVWTAMHYGAYLYAEHLAKHLSEGLPNPDGSARDPNLVKQAVELLVGSVSKMDRWFIVLGIVLCVLVELVLAVVTALPSTRMTLPVASQGHQLT